MHIRVQEDKKTGGQEDLSSNIQIKPFPHSSIQPFTLIDTHSHIDMPDFEDLDSIILNAKNAGVENIIIPSVDRDSFEKVIEISNQYEGVYCSLGIHPSEAQKANEKDFEEIIELCRLGLQAQQNKIVAIGECGLDYYWDKTYIEEQKEAFLKQIEIALVLKKPLIVHDREAHKDTFDMLKEIKDIPIVMHCFSGSLEFARECIKQRFYIALGGVVTFKNAKKAHEIAKEIPLEYLLLETDAPYLTPEPYRGKRNEPAYVKLVAEKIAEIRGISYEEVAQKTTENARKVFGL